jgi:hypothetical protein
MNLRTYLLLTDYRKIKYMRKFPLSRADVDRPKAARNGNRRKAMAQEPGITRRTKCSFLHLA